MYIYLEISLIMGTIVFIILPNKIDYDKITPLHNVIENG